MSRTRRWAWIGVLVLVLGGCGSDPGTDGDDTHDGDGGGFNNYIMPHQDAGGEDEDGGPDPSDAADVDDEADDADDAGMDTDTADVPTMPDVQPDVAPTDPWEGTDGLRGGALKAALRDRIDDHRVFDYNQSRDLMYGRAATIDVHDGMIECIYTGRMVRPDGSRTPGGFNTEHSWPRDDGADVEPMVSDLHHLFPTDDEANAARGTWNFGETSCTTGCEYSNGGSMLGPNAEGPGTVFEVRPARRGDIARAHFYFAVRYDRAIPTGEEAALRRWHAEDPPDALEEGRNDAIERFQRNRNPFVDRPDFVERIDNF